MTKKAELKKCGIVMPISPIENLTAEHWKDVLVILNDTIKDSGFEPNLVSNSNESGVIQKRIIQNLYSNPIVICDVSAKNPNVMFELGVRLAFDKPTIIIKDDKTNYSFDTSPIEHLDYPRDLRFSSIVAFKKELSKKIKATYDASINDENYSTFLKHFGQYKVAGLKETEISSDRYILESIENLTQEVNLLRNYSANYQNIRLTKYFDEQEINSRILDSKIGEFLQTHSLKNTFEIKPAGLKDELYEFLNNSEEVRAILKNKTELENIVEFATDLDDVPF